MLTCMDDIFQGGAAAAHSGFHLGDEVQNLKHHFTISDIPMIHTVSLWRYYLFSSILEGD